MNQIRSVKKLCGSLLLSTILASYPFPSHAIQEGEFLDPRLVRLSLGGLIWDGNFQDTINGVPAVVINGETGEPFEFPSGSGLIMLDATYFIMDHFAVEAAISYSDGFDRELAITNFAGETQTREYSLNMVPMDLNFQYHFAPYGKLTPYVGAGITYAVFLGKDTENSFGYNAKLGLDYWGSKNTTISLGIKRYFGLETSTQIDFPDVAALFESDIEVNPTYFTVGFGYRF